MQYIIKTILWVLIVMLALSSLLALSGVIYLWIWRAGDEKNADLPYLNWLLGLTIAEVVGIALLFAKKGLTYLPEVLTNKAPEETNKFMHELWGAASSVVIVSNRLAWLASSEALQNRILELTAKGTRFEIITPKLLQGNFRKTLGDAGVSFFVTKDEIPPEARFTLINANRSGSEKLAIARGVHPGHEITIFDTNSGPQIIAMAKDIVRKAKVLANAS